MSLAIRITLPKETAASILDIWMRHCDQIIAYEHSESNRVHCHVLMIQPHVTTQRLKQLSLREERGNTFWSFKTGTGDISRYITYMSKGKLSPFYHRVNMEITDAGLEECFTDVEIWEAKQLWVEPAAKTPKQLQEYIEFEKWLQEYPISERDTKDKIKHYARVHCFRKHQMFHQQCNNQIANYAATYSYKNHVL